METTTETQPAAQVTPPANTTPAAPPATHNAGGAASGGAGAQSATSGGTATSTPASDKWYSGFNDELRGYVESKGFKDPEMAVDSYRNLEKLMGVPKDQILKLPTEAGSPEWNKVFERLGKPEKAEAYQIEVPKDTPAAGKEFVDWAKNAAHKANMTSDQFKTLMGEWNTSMTAQTKAANDAAVAANKADGEALKTEWGNAYEQKEQMAKVAAKDLGLDEATVAALQNNLGYSKTMKLFADIGAKFGEATHQGAGERPAPALDVASAKAQVAIKRADSAYMAKYLAKDPIVYPEFCKLMADANPGESRVG